MTREITFKDSKFSFLARRKSSFFIDHLVKTGELENYNTFGLKIPFRSLVKSENGIADIYGNDDSLDYFHNEFFQEIQNEDRFRELIDKTKEIGERLRQKINSEDFNFGEFISKYKEFMPTLAITTGLASDVQELIVNEMNNNDFSNDNLEALLYSSEKSVLQKEHLDSLRISQKIQETSSNLEENTLFDIIEEHYHKYRHIPVNYNGDEWSLDYLKDKIFSQAEELDCSTEIEKLRTNDLRLNKQRIELLSGKDSSVFDFAVNFGKLNEYRKDIISQANLKLKEYLIPISTKVGIPIDDIINLSYDEIVNDSLSRDDLVSLIESREKGFVNISLNKFYTFYDIDSFQENSYAFDEDSQIKGICASAGYTVGKVKLIEKDDDYHPEKDDILVASMTSVDTVNYLRETKGIITDEGGITCHAAIVARELGKPCIVGSKIATKQLSDGDYVILDSNNGLVSKISKEEFNALKKDNDLSSEKKTFNETITIQPKHYDSDIIPLDESSLGYDCGNKANNLMRLASNSNVPRGFVVTPKAMHTFMDENYLLKKIQNKDYNQIMRLFTESDFNNDFITQLQNNYQPYSSGDVVARSSNSLEDLPNLSFAGQYETYLELENFNRLEEAIKKCWASCYNPRVIDYLADNNIIVAKPEMSVIVQKQIHPQKSGVLFTANPITGDSRGYVLEVVDGDCENLVSGIKTPTTYQESKNNLILGYEPLIEKALELESQSGHPVDVEWCMDQNGKFYLLQMRAITALK
jgi:phosphohistidine swiveling domain-containing protein